MAKLNLYLLEQSENNDWDTYDSVVVAATDVEAARKVHPTDKLCPEFDNWKGNSWASKPENVTVTLIGIADDTVKPGVILASFNAG